MAKFELSTFDTKTGEVEKVHQRAFIPITLYLKFQKLAEETSENKVDTDKKMFNALKPLILELFPDLTEFEYDNNVDVADILFLWEKIVHKSAEISTGNSKNA